MSPTAVDHAPAFERIHAQCPPPSSWMSCRHAPGEYRGRFYSRTYSETPKSRKYHPNHDTREKGEPQGDEDVIPVEGDGVPLKSKPAINSSAL